MTKRALITGASSGIGRCFADQLAAEKYDLVIVARDVERLERTKRELVDTHGIDVEVLPADLSDDAAVTRVADRILDESSPIDFVINNAGFGSKSSFLEMSADDHEQMLRVNINALVRLSHAALTAMVKRNSGDLINVGSVAGFMTGFRSSATYAATKMFVIAFTEGLLPTIAHTKVRASVLCPGFVKTEFHQRARITKGKVSPLLWLEAEPVVRAALADHRKGRLMSVPTLRYKLIVGVARLVPRNFLLKQMNRMGKR